MGDKYYLLDSRSFVGNCCLWWAPKGAGYVCNLDEAGRYDANASSRATDIPIPEDVARSCVVAHVRIETLRDEMSKLGLPMLNERAAEAERTGFASEPTPRKKARST